MRSFARILAFALLLAGCASHRTTSDALSDFYFLPCAAKASVSFEGESQFGRRIHRLEVRRLAYRAPGEKRGWPTTQSCVLYYAGGDYDPFILRVLDDCIDPLVRKVSPDLVEVYFLAGAHTHIKQQWRLLGGAAKLESEGEIDWQDDPRMNSDAVQNHGDTSDARSTSTLTSPTFRIMIEVRCPEGETACEDVHYVGINKETSVRTTLVGREIHSTGADGITPGHFLGYLFKNGSQTYFVGEDGEFQIREGARVLLEETGVWSWAAERTVGRFGGWKRNPRKFRHSSLRNSLVVRA